MRAIWCRHRGLRGRIQPSLVGGAAGHGRMEDGPVPVVAMMGDGRGGLG